MGDRISGRTKGGDDDTGGVDKGEDEGSSSFNLGPLTTIVSTGGFLVFGEEVFLVPLISNFFAARESGFGGSTRSSGSGDKSVGSLSGLSEGVLDLVSSGFAPDGVAFLGGIGETAGFCDLGGTDFESIFSGFRDFCKLGCELDGVLSAGSTFWRFSGCVVGVSSGRFCLDSGGTLLEAGDGGRGGRPCRGGSGFELRGSLLTFVPFKVSRDP